MAELQGLVDSLDGAYASLSTLDGAFALMVGDREDFDPTRIYGYRQQSDYAPRTLAVAAEFVEEHRKQVRRYIDGGNSPYDDSQRYSRLLGEEGRLIVHSFRMNSPVLWEFIGSQNPLEALRNALNDRHSRRQDREYREAAEAERLAQQNERLRLENLEIAERIAYRRIEALKSAGVSKKEIQAVTRRVLGRNIERLQTIGDTLHLDASEPIEQIHSNDPRFPR